MTRYSRVDAEQLISDATATIAALAQAAKRLHELREVHGESGSEAAWLHAQIDGRLAWFEQRSVRLDRIDPVALAFPARLILNDDACDVWLSWQPPEATIGWFYPLDSHLAARQPIPESAVV